MASLAPFQQYHLLPRRTMIIPISFGVDNLTWEYVQPLLSWRALLPNPEVQSYLLPFGISWVDSTTLTGASRIWNLSRWDCSTGVDL